MDFFVRSGFVMREIAMVLSGCGRIDGSEISEVVLVCLELSRHGLKHCFFAPDIQFDVVDHASGSQTNERRSVIVEASRIVDCNIKPLASLDAKSYDALIFPGGCGVIKNLSNINTEKKAPKILPEVQGCVESFYKDGKPIVSLCIAPALVAFCLQNSGISLTLGPSDHNSMVAVSGNKHVPCEANGCVVDSQNKIISTPAFMASNDFSEIHEGIHQAISAMYKMLTQ